MLPPFFASFKMALNTFFISAERKNFFCFERFPRQTKASKPDPIGVFEWLYYAAALACELAMAFELKAGLRPS